MNDIIRKHIGINTPKETDKAVEQLADDLAVMDRAQGIFGESISNEELEEVAGGVPWITKQPNNIFHVPCQYPGCKNTIYWVKHGAFQQPPKYCGLHARL